MSLSCSGLLKRHHRKTKQKKQPTVVFRNVGQLYFPQSRVECHYSLEPAHRWSGSDWVGIFQEGSSVSQYHTYTWALVPEGHTDGSSTNCCVVFSASYLPKPSAARYEFRYVDKAGRVCARSRPFTFCLPKPLGELETLKEEEDGWDGEEELLVVVPRTQLLQSRLDECLRKQEEVQRALDETGKEMEKEKENRRRERGEWERERDAMREVISQLRDRVRENCERMEKMEGRHEDETHRHDSLTCEVASLTAQRSQSQQLIRALEDEKEALRQAEREGRQELDRLKDRLKETSIQMKGDEAKRRTLQVEAEAALQEARGLQERLEASERAAEDLRRELRELGARLGYAHTELHQARLQVARLTLQLSEEDLLLREERANWALEREAYKHAAESDKAKLQGLSCEVQRKEAWLQEERRGREKLEAQLGSQRGCSRVLNGARREPQELQRSRFNAAPASPDEEGASSPSARSMDSPLFLSADPEQPGTPERRAQTHVVDKGDALTCQGQEEEAAGGRKRAALPQRDDRVLSDLADSPMW